MDLEITFKQNIFCIESVAMKFLSNTLYSDVVTKRMSTRIIVLYVMFFKHLK
jgi:hypothetical protein